MVEMMVRRLDFRASATVVRGHGNFSTMNLTAIGSAIFGSWHQSKLRIENVLGIDHDILHIFIGVAVWLLAATLTRRSIASALPIVVLVIAALFNEAVDLWVERWPDPVEQYGEGAKDIALTMAIPLTLMMLARRRPAMFRRL